MMNTAEIETAAAALGNQLSAGIPIHQVVNRMAKLQPRYADQWREIARQIDAGNRLSEQLDGLWPEGLVSAVKAGEQSGNMPEVLAQIEETMDLQQKINQTARKLLYPLALMVGAFGAFLFFMLEVIPVMAKQFRGAEGGLVMATSAWMVDVVTNHMTVVIAIIAAVGTGAVLYLRSAHNREKLIDKITRLPKVGEALKLLYFALWARYVAILYSAGGIPITNALNMTSKVLPLSGREAVDKASTEIDRRGLAESMDPEAQPDPTDPRHVIPFYVANAFLVADQTGRLDVELERVAPAMLKEGFRGVEKGLKSLMMVSMIVAALLVITPFIAYYVQLGKSIQAALGGA